MRLPLRIPALLSRTACGRAAFFGAVLISSLGACERSATRGADTVASSDSARRAAAPSADTTHHDASRAAASAAPITSDTSDPTATVRAYLASLRAQATTRDTMLWEPATGGDDGFRTFHDTTIVASRIGAPDRIEGAAGSRYTDVPLVLDVATRTAPIRLRGTVTLRRAVVDGASDAQRRWRITRIQWSAPTAPTLDSATSHR